MALLPPSRTIPSHLPWDHAHALALAAAGWLSSSPGACGDEDARAPLACGRDVDCEVGFHCGAANR
jgi:hypothetical protein